MQNFDACMLKQWLCDNDNTVESNLNNVDPGSMWLGIVCQSSLRQGLTAWLSSTYALSNGVALPRRACRGPGS